MAFPNCKSCKHCLMKGTFPFDFRRDREIEEPEVLFEAQEDDDDDEQEQPHHHLPAHRLTLSDSER